MLTTKRRFTNPFLASEIFSPELAPSLEHAENHGRARDGGERIATHLLSGGRRCYGRAVEEPLASGRGAAWVSGGCVGGAVGRVCSEMNGEMGEIREILKKLVSE